MSTQVIEGASAGRHVVGGPLTVAVSKEAVPGLIRNAIDQRIIKVRPTSTPIDQISRCGCARQSRAMKVEYYSVDPKKTETQLTKDVAGGIGTRKAEDVFTHTIPTDCDLLFEASETVMFPGVEGSNGQPLIGYVVGRAQAGGIEIIAANAPVVEGYRTMPALKKDQKIIRMGRAASELDVQTAQFQALPTKRSNNCQIFKMQVEESTLHKIANKEVGWTFSDQEEAAIIDMRLGMEKNFLFGAQTVLHDPIKNEDIYLTGGIWNQATRKVDISTAAFNEEMLIHVAMTAFTENCGSKRKLLLCGTELMTKINKMECTKVRRGGETKVKWGLTFDEVVTNFGTLCIIHSEIFDQCGHRGDGMVIDPDYLTKYVHIPFHAEKLDLRRSGQRNTSAVVITEASCLVLRYPETHLRVIDSLGKTTAAAQTA